MIEEKMQACPFCGWLETPTEKAEHIIVDGAHCLQCRRCKAVGPQTFDENGGVMSWNKRAGGQQPAMSKTPEPSTSASANGSALLTLQEVEFLMWCIGITEGHVEKTGDGSRKDFIEKMKDSTIDKLWKLKAPNTKGQR